MAAALEEWTYSTSPSDRDAIARRLSTTFPAADVRRSDASTADDVRVDGVRVVIAHRLGSAFRRDFHMLADRFDDVVVYSTTCHTSTPNEWREFKHRHRGDHAGARVRFVHRREAAADDGGSTVRALAALALPIMGIVGLLTASLGLFSVLFARARAVPRRLERPVQLGLEGFLGVLVALGLFAFANNVTVVVLGRGLF
ncbi:hypothetical protein CP556_09330 [Natrinema sp. CBA1119]|uniref:hypothetical protein n=1 Tax=Natrinema sp. CBA1119 TaxID=1608465 RepID=UPI000BF95BCB|nr:hypothetical protein [Natrinema sp. CBA1119]PGF16298.1 hypothetical protein CP556_09330 [Natrinema sp. CBA1119]